MANIGLRRFYVSPVLMADGDPETEAAIELAESFGTLLYEGDPENENLPFVVPGARRAQVTYNKFNSELYGDDLLAEHDQVTLSADIEIEWAPRYTDNDYSRDGLLPERLERIDAFGVEAYGDPEEGPVSHLLCESGRPVGFGFVQVQIVNGRLRYRAIKFHKVTFSLETEETQTKEERIEWGCPILRGHAETVEIRREGSTEEQLREFAEFATIAEAEAWLAARFPAAIPENWKLTSAPNPSSFASFSPAFDPDVTRYTATIVTGGSTPDHSLNANWVVFPNAVANAPTWTLGANTTPNCGTTLARTVAANGNVVYNLQCGEGGTWHYTNVDQGKGYYECLIEVVVTQHHDGQSGGVYVYEIYHHHYDTLPVVEDVEDTTDNPIPDPTTAG